MPVNAWRTPKKTTNHNTAASSARGEPTQSLFSPFFNAAYALIGVVMPISDCQVRDPRIRRTRKLLQGALGTLMQTKSFDEISVQDITEAATVNRATFYDHYTDKFALLDAMVAGGFHEFLDERQVRYDARRPAAVGVIVLAACDFLAQVHSGGACDRQTAFEPLVDAAIVAALGRLLLEGMRREEHPPALPPEMVAAAASWAICGGVKQWLSMPDRPPAPAIVPQLLELLLPMLNAPGTRAESPVEVEANPRQ
jgi:AcrR family transcriptional regulator